MPDATPHALAESLLAFWADAGIDAALLDEPVDRIEAGKILPPRPAPPPLAMAGVRSDPVGRATAGAADVSSSIAQAQSLAAEAQDMESLAAAIAAFEGSGPDAQALNERHATPIRARRLNAPLMRTLFSIPKP